MTDHEGINIDKEFGVAVAKGSLIGLPPVLVLMVVAVWAITDQSLGQAVVTALLPGILLGLFGGGFIGSVIATKH